MNQNKHLCLTGNTHIYQNCQHGCIFRADNFYPNDKGILPGCLFFVAPQVDLTKEEKDEKIRLYYKKYKGIKSNSNIAGYLGISVNYLKKIASKIA